MCLRIVIHSKMHSKILTQTPLCYQTLWDNIFSTFSDYFYESLCPDFFPMAMGSHTKAHQFARLILDGITLYMGYHVTLVISYLFGSKCWVWFNFLCTFYNSNNQIDLLAISQTVDPSAIKGHSLVKHWDMLSCNAFVMHSFSLKGHLKEHQSYTWLPEVFHVSEATRKLTTKSVVYYLKVFSYL